MADAKQVIAGKVFTALNLYIIDDYRLLQDVSSSESEILSGLTIIETESEITNPYPLKNMLFEIEYKFRITRHDTPKNKCEVLLKKFNKQIEKAQLLLQVKGAKSGIVLFDLIESLIEIEELDPDNYRIRLIDLKTGQCIFEKEEVISMEKVLKEKKFSLNNNTVDVSEMAKARIIVSSQQLHKEPLDDYSEASFLNLIFGVTPRILSAAE